jgi:hypothetical protein
MPDDELTTRAREIQEQLDALPHIRVEDAKRLFVEQRRNADYRILELELEKAQLELALERANRRIENMNRAPKWLEPAGLGFGCMTFLFLGLIVILSIVGRVVPPTSRFALVAFMAFGAAFASAAWIGKVTLSGDISPDSKKPLILSASGGFAIFVLVFLFGYWFYIK